MHRLGLIFLLIINMTSVFAGNLSPAQQFLVLSDIHFDPFISCTQRPCPLIQQLRQHAVTAWPQLLQQQERKPSHLLQDTNSLLLEESLAAAKNEMKQSQASFVLVLGDLLGHEFFRNFKKYADDPSRGNYQVFLRNVLAYLTQRLRAAFPDASIYILAGNNDSSYGDYFTVPNSPFFKEAAQLWSGLIKNSAQQASMARQFSYAGYYAVTFPADPSAQLLMLNSNVFSYKEKGKRADEIAQREFTWLHAQLESAKKNHQRVLIAMHIPDGVDAYGTLRIRLFRLMVLWKPRYVQRFQAELQSYAPEIAGVLSGHMHASYFHVQTFGKDEIPWIGAPAISPIYGSNTGFQVVTFKISPLEIMDCKTIKN